MHYGIYKDANISTLKGLQGLQQVQCSWLNRRDFPFDICGARTITSDEILTGKSLFALMMYIVKYILIRMLRQQRQLLLVNALF